MSNNRKQKLSPSFSPFFFFASTLVEEPYSVPSSLWNDSKFKIITIAWLLTAMIFTNLYAGLMITELSVPLKGEVLHELQDIFGTYKETDSILMSSLKSDLMFWYYNYSNSDKPFLFLDDYEINLDYSDFGKHLQQFREIEHFALLQASDICEPTNVLPSNERQRLSNPTLYKIFKQFQWDSKYMDMKDKRLNPKYEFHVSNFMSPKYRHYPIDPKFPIPNERLIKHFTAAAVEKEIVACGRSICLADLDELQAELRYLKQSYPETAFYVGNGTVENGWRRKLVWYYGYTGNPVLAQYLRLLLQAGIRTHVTSILNHKTYLERRIGTKLIKEMEPPAMGMDMNGSIQTIFIILVAVLLSGS
jgi:hypothetical protein